MSTLRMMMTSSEEVASGNAKEKTRRNVARPKQAIHWHSCNEHKPRNKQQRRNKQ